MITSITEKYPELRSGMDFMGLTFYRLTGSMDFERYFYIFLVDTTEKTVDQRNGTT